MESKHLQVYMTDPKKLKPYFNNPRHNDKAVMALVKVIPRIGFNVPIVVDKDMVIIKGHSRWNAARILELEEVPIIISEGTDEQNNRDRVLDNAIHDLTEWDYNMLKVEIEETGINLDSYKLRWISKIMGVEKKPAKGGRENVVVTIACPSCKTELKYNKKELLK